MNRSVRIEVLPLRRDPRGSVVEPLPPELLRDQRNVHVAVSVPGAVRGNHYHERGTEVLTVYGPALVRTRSGDRVADSEVPDEAVWRFTIPPGISHAVRNTGTRPALLIAFNSEAHDPDRPDLVRDPILPP